MSIGQVEPHTGFAPVVVVRLMLTKQVQSAAMRMRQNEVYESSQTPALDYETRPALSRGIDHKVVGVRVERTHGAYLAQSGV